MEFTHNYRWVPYLKSWIEPFYSNPNKRQNLLVIKYLTKKRKEILKHEFAFTQFRFLKIGSF